MSNLERVEDAVLVVWEELGSGHTEAMYRNALSMVLYPARMEVPVPVEFQGQIVGVGAADIVLYDQGEPFVVVELKSVQGRLTNAHRAQLRAYLRGLSCQTGILVNFPVEGDPEVELCDLAIPLKAPKKNPFGRR